MEQYKPCQNCGYYSDEASSNCELCGKSLINEIQKQPGQKLSDKEKLNQYISSVRKKRNINLSISIVSIVILTLGGVVIWQYISPIVLKAETEKEKVTYEQGYAAKNLPSAILRYNGPACSMLLTSTKITEAITSVNRNFILRPTDSDRGKSDIEELIDSQLSVVFSEKPLSPKYRNLADTRGIGLKQTAVAIDGIAYITNKVTIVNSLTVEQLEQIYEGRITNWKEVGSANRTITPILLSGKGRNAIFLRLTQLNPNIIYVRNREAAIKAIKENPGSIFYTSSTLVKEDNTVNIIPLKNKENTLISPVIGGQINQEAFESGMYPQTRTLYAIYKEDGTPEQTIARAFTEYLTSSEGQKAIKEAGFVPLYFKY